LGDAELNPITYSIEDEYENGQPSYITVSPDGDRYNIIVSCPVFDCLGNHTLIITVTDDYLTNNYIIGVEFVNTPPTFTTVPVDRTVANNRNLTYTIPPSSDIEGNPYNITLAPSLPWVVLTGNQISVTAPPLSSVGTNTMTLTLNDGNQAKSYNFSIFVTNTAPRFTTNPSAAQSLAINAPVVSYLYSDSESNPITVTCSDETNSGTPSYISVNSTYVSIRAITVASVGPH
jgi:hypothetical protein